jgi:hypothetical protein
VELFNVNPLLIGISDLHFKVRGPSYLVDHVKVPSATESQLLAVEVFRAPHVVT